MSRYLREAFFLRSGRIPWNVLAVCAVVAGGFFNPAIWLAGALAEAVYLAAVGSSAWLRRRVAARDEGSLREDTEDSRRALMFSLGGAARQRYIRLEESRRKVERLYGESGRDDFLFESNRDALARLSWLFLRLLVAQRNLVATGARTTVKDIDAEIETLRAEIAAGAESETLRRSREARLEILMQRADNLGRREQSLAEIDSDLARIESQMQLALEQASLADHPVAISTNVELVSHILDDNLATPGAQSEEATTASPGRETQ